MDDIKLWRMTFGKVFILAGIGFFGTFFLLRSGDFYFPPKTFGLTLWESLSSLCILIIFCAICARVISWIYSGSQLHGRSKLIFLLSFFALMFSAALRIWFYFLQFQYYSSILGDKLRMNLISIGNINYFVLTLGLVVTLSGMIVLVLLWVSYLRERKESLVLVSSGVKKLKTAPLVIVTVVFLVIVLRSLFNYMYFAAVFDNFLKQDEIKTEQSLWIEKDLAF